VTRYFTDDEANMGKAQLINWVNAKIDNLKLAIAEELESQLFGDGSGNGGKDLDGLGNLVDATPTSARTVGNIAQTTYTWWQNKQKTASGAASVYLLSDMRRLANDVSKGQTLGRPDIIVTTSIVDELFEDEVLEQKQIVNQSSGDPMMLSNRFKGIPIVWSDQCPSGYLYMLNSRNISLNVDPGMWLQPSGWKEPVNSRDRSMQVMCKLNMVSNRRSSLGVLTGIAA